jgi:hypothetical protein
MTPRLTIVAGGSMLSSLIFLRRERVAFAKWKRGSHSIVRRSRAAVGIEEKRHG